MVKWLSAVKKTKKNHCLTLFWGVDKILTRNVRSITLNVWPRIYIYYLSIALKGTQGGNNSISERGSQVSAAALYMSTAIPTGLLALGSASPWPLSLLRRALSEPLWVIGFHRVSISQLSQALPNKVVDNIVAILAGDRLLCGYDCSLHCGG